MTKVTFVPEMSSAEWMNIFKTSPEIRAGLMTYASAAAARNTAALQASPNSGAKPEHRFIAVVDVADKTMLGKVVATNGAKSAALKAKLPRW